ncbi:hypothetical protein HRR83_003853 [Exophiala dermatitidis]|uniref:HRQ family protein 2 n=2 Tax=Exophiala dermatitidis TaxID=5970 RepID=H6BPN6_EXODN|nr:uncharacterized protein HMPREF1120_01826 [Exophiala dermatitidis NIH/UT8656]KAJ4522181.1 hypothetical protein HRR74_002763 [Exophiala dermatitidis]EHY53638.1 hypothetical protein HMPREF1120_01826 [Exophiala dermatitidis NIH/UT8656]KAJ4529507.1 hypothetical protein HRR73_000532 [Exophiala dermatitidis]KAJ4557494.1 hypothetical protein HRR78_001164 [Exophiala dermatitidis]KAJ4575299.1 hypothetical protein HRR79_002225 [Exophiala dermatitidis]
MPNHLSHIEKPSFLWHIRSWEDIQAASRFTLANYLNVILLIVFVFLAIRQAKVKQQEAAKAGHDNRYLKAPEFPPVEEQADFDWKTTEPLQLRPFKPKYHLTMAESDESALENLSPSELLMIDNTYEERIAYRRRIMAEHGKHVINVHDDFRIRPAVVELYQYLLGTYLPLRFPTLFKLHETEYEQGKTFMLENRVTGALFPAKVTPQTPTEQLLHTLGQTVDEDFLFLLPEEDTEDPKYVLEAYVNVCPSGFDPAEKLGKRLAAIHEPVPGYAAKLEGSMDRFFSRVEAGKYVKRVNWTVTTHSELFAAAKGSTHAHEGDVVEELDHIDVDKTFLRCERQTLHRLPKSQALVFAFHTYLYPIQRIKDEGLGEELATAIDGLKSGNAPQMHFYKRGAVWGEAVKRYLRS